MKKLLLVNIILFIFFSNNNLANIKTEIDYSKQKTNINDFDQKKQKEKFIEKLNLLKSSKKYKSKIAKKLTTELGINYKSIENIEDKKEISKLIRELAQKEKQDGPTIKQTILNSINKLTNKSSVICLTIITFMYQIKGIITAPELLMIFEQIRTIIEKSTTFSWSISIVKFISGILPIASKLLG